MDAAPSSPPSLSHKRTPSASILSRLPFLRPHPSEPPSTSDDAPPSSTSSIKTRRRKGSLRKTALLGTGRLRHDAAEPSLHTTTSPTTIAEPSPRRPWPAPPPPLSLDIHAAALLTPATLISPPSTTATSPATSPASRYASTTDDDEGLSMRVSPVSGAALGLSRRRSSRAAGTVRPDAAIVIEAGGHDYSNTAWWGWVVLLSTWVVFVVGMGSCLDVWSWAWDVGETPYAPPELEDDPTLPIVGYYPALIVMTGVMAWVWVVVAWVGMKYFRHAKVWDGGE
ncbi:hypothetical protein EJ06DRAFT_534279 [Trichodelitschia bisporula]|uniref:Uncharacterized protein n=1 Tax=Trichodelitschia bisporula TaxID=703511 RepID=A0A6G1HJF3_9PEZI|nr:hypothetical protein EJ06DRAFT_534279 [Trichodelitschia bisporula]